MRIDDRWIFAFVVGLAFFLRMTALGMKPPHFDEGVNGWFVDQMTREGFYHYDPSNFHGPMHFYLLFIAQALFGRHVWALRLPVALISTGGVAMAFAFRRFVSERTCLVAALAMAVSPGMTFYGRYAIHEPELVFFMMLAIWGLAGLCGDGTASSSASSGPGNKPLWAAALGATGMILTKETYAIHFIAFALAFPALQVWERFSPSAESTFHLAPRVDAFAGWEWVAAVCGGSILFFYTGAFLDWSALPGLWQAFAYWGATATNGASGHEKEWHYWIELLVRYEWTALAGLAGVAWLLWPGRDRFVRYLGIAATGALVGYSIVSYKTPWCIISIVWPLLFVFGYLVDCGMARLDRWVTGAFASLGIFGTLLLSLSLNFKDFADENEPYVYVQTTEDVYKITHPLRWLTSFDPAYYHVAGHVLIPVEESHPLPWLLGDFTQVDYLDREHPPQPMDAEFLLVDDSIVSDTEEKLNDVYFKDSFLLRGNSPQFVSLYLRASTFAPYFPGRSPEFNPQRTDSSTK